MLHEVVFSPADISRSGSRLIYYLGNMLHERGSNTGPTNPRNMILLMVSCSYEPL